jgi:hypothetical protein
MVWRIGARVHAFVHGLFKPSEAELVRAQYDELAEQFAEYGIADNAGRASLIAVIADRVCTELDIPADHEQSSLINAFVERLFDYDELFVLPDVDWRATHSIAELWGVRELLSRQRTLVADFEEVCSLIVTACAAMLEPI